MEVSASNPSTREVEAEAEAEAGGALTLRLAWSEEKIQGHPGMQREILFQETKGVWGWWWKERGRGVPKAGMGLLCWPTWKPGLFYTSLPCSETQAILIHNVSGLSSGLLPTGF